MKKFIAICAIACAAFAFAALDINAVDEEVAFPAQTVNAGAAVTNAAVVVSGRKGLCEISITCGSVAAASSNRTVTVTLQGTNTVSGGWATINSASYKGAEAGVVRVPFAGEYLPKYIRVIVADTTANSVVGGNFIFWR